jgi:phosphonate transport system substrate-binding protein
VPVRALVASDYAGSEALRGKQFELAFVDLLADREARYRIPVRDIREARPPIGWLLSEHKDRGGIRLVEDLRSKTVAFVDPAWSSGYIYPMVLLDPPE